MSGQPDEPDHRVDDGGARRPRFGGMLPPFGIAWPRRFGKLQAILVAWVLVLVTTVVGFALFAPDRVPAALVPIMNALATIISAIAS